MESWVSYEPEIVLHDSKSLCNCNPKILQLMSNPSFGPTQLNIRAASATSFLIKRFVDFLIELLDSKDFDLTGLRLKDFTFTDKQFELFVHILSKSNASLTSLSLLGLKIIVLDSQIESSISIISRAIVQILECNTTLIALELDGIYGTLRTEDRLISTLCTLNTTLRFLILPDTRFYYSSLAILLRQNSTLQGLSIYNINTPVIGLENNDSEFDEFCQSLATNNTLTHLKLNGKRIPTTTSSFLAALQTNTTLRQLYFGLSDRDRIRLTPDLSILSAFNTLSHLQVWSSFYIPCKVETFCDFLDTNTSLVSLNISLDFPKTVPELDSPRIISAGEYNCPKLVCDAFDRSPTLQALNPLFSSNYPSIAKINQKKKHNHIMKNLLLITLLLENDVSFEFKEKQTLST